MWRAPSFAGIIGFMGFTRERGASGYRARGVEECYWLVPTLVYNLCTGNLFHGVKIIKQQLLHFD